jgi:GNAT superfamily N-acetyltransferase
MLLNFQIQKFSPLVHNNKEYLVKFASKENVKDITLLINKSYEVENFFKKECRTNDEEIISIIEKNQKKILLLINEDKIISEVCLETKGNNLYFSMFAVDVDEQGKGLGKQVIKLIENIGKSLECEYLTMSVASCRENLIDFYCKIGFKVNGKENWENKNNIKDDYKEIFFYCMEKKLE